MKVKGLNQFITKLKDLEKKAKKLDGTHSVPISELLTPSFMQRYTSFPTFAAMLEASGFRAETQAEFDAIPNDKWDAFIATQSQFSDWQSMLSKAAKEWTQKKLGS